MYPQVLVNLCLHNYINNCMQVKDISSFTMIHKSTIYRWIERYNYALKKEIIIDTKSVEYFKMIRRKRATYWKKIKEPIIEYLQKYMSTRIVINVKYIIKEIKRKFNVKIAKSTIYKIIKVNLNMSYKKLKNKLVLKKNLVTHATKVKDLIKKVNEIGVDNIYSLDESHFYLNMYRVYGWSKKGEICVSDKISIIRKKYSLLQIISNKKIIKYKLYEGTIKTPQLLDFMKGILLPENSHILLDNARVHTSNIFKDYVKENNINLLYNVSYSPETNPIEMVFSKVKNIVRSRDNSTEEKMTKSIVVANKNIIKRDLTNFYKKSFLQE
jgi:transposase